MKRSNFAFLSIILLVFAAGCSSPTVTNPTPQVNYQSGQVYIYYAQVLDKTTGDTTAGSGDTIRSVVVATGISYQGMTGVTEIQNTHTNPPTGSSTVDTTYIAQTNGNYYHYDYGLESLNNNPYVLAVTGGPIEAGWILQAELSAGPNQTWIAADTTFAVANGAAHVTLTDTATEQADTTIVVGDTVKPNEQTATAGPISIFTKHSMHNITVSLVGGTGTLGQGTADTYVSSQYGPVLDIVYPSELQQQKAPGRRMVLIQAPQ